MKMEDFEEFKNRHILDVKKIIKGLEGNLEKFKSMKSRFPEPTQEQIDKLSKRKKREFIQKYERFLSFVKEIKTKTCSEYISKSNKLIFVKDMKKPIMDYKIKEGMLELN